MGGEVSVLSFFDGCLDGPASEDGGRWEWDDVGLGGGFAVGGSGTGDSRGTALEARTMSSPPGCSSAFNTVEYVQQTFSNSDGSITRTFPFVRRACLYLNETTKLIGFR